MRTEETSLYFNIPGAVMIIAGIAYNEQTEHQVRRVGAQCIVLGGPDAGSVMQAA